MNGPDTGVSESPLILTLTLNPGSFAYFDDLRRRHFPPERNFIPAHLTLFHHLPGNQLDRVRGTLEAVAADTGAMTLVVTGLSRLGGGVAYRLEAAELMTLRRRLAGAFAAWLTPQDRQKFSPHVTIQNKVPPSVARALHEAMSRCFTPFPARATGLDLWRYLGGPWQHAGHFAFRRDPQDTGGQCR